MATVPVFRNHGLTPAEARLFAALNALYKAQDAHTRALAEYDQALAAVAEQDKNKAQAN